MNKKHIDLEIQGGIIRRFTDLVLDYTGMLSLDGVLLPGVVERLARISAGLRITIMTADTFVKAADQTKGLPVDFRIIKTGIEEAGAVLMMGGENVISRRERPERYVNDEPGGLENCGHRPGRGISRAGPGCKFWTPVFTGVTGFYTFCKAGNFDIHIIAC